MVLLMVNFWFIFLKPRQMCLTPEANTVGSWDLVLMSRGQSLCGSMVGRGCCLVVVVADGGVTASLGEDGNLGSSVQRLVWRMVDGGAGRVRPEAGGGLLR